MEHPDHFRINLERIKNQEHLSLTQFARKVRIPSSTMQFVMKGGQTSLDTACRISSALGMPLSLLAGDTLLAEQAGVAYKMSLLLDLSCNLPEEQQTQLCIAINSILEILRK